MGEAPHSFPPQPQGEAASVHSYLMQKSGEVMPGSRSEPPSLPYILFSHLHTLTYATGGSEGGPPVSA